ncbi:hypothetical protein ACMA5K_24110 [Bradyrhizobium diazoefficiens]|uniref:hypothetical protein n=1 Tax=Bradyrhizobium diazoefficiens TaxID=1355477 RepID=UPI000BE7DFE0|nr:hypothetical protein [Bradyrhizobium diazoefficiens]PDT58729.1 hypothetical protein CO678_26215 [Bradyrhizobium diazoefficiens]QLD43829.1 hypothetical protein HUW42_23890 [Bradyrhizobium diazoefficiens]
MWMILYAYLAIGLVVGCIATLRNRSIFRFGSFRAVRAIAHTIIVGLLWWLLGPLALGFGRRKYQ